MTDLSLVRACEVAVIASEAKQSSFFAKQKAGLLRRFAPRNDDRQIYQR
jgi:hypothetical protein